MLGKSNDDTDSTTSCSAEAGPLHGTTLSLLVLPNAGLAVSGSRDCSIRLWTSTATPVSKACGQAQRAHGPAGALPLDGNPGLPDLVASGSADAHYRVWDVSGRDQWSKQTTLRGHTVRNK